MLDTIVLNWLLGLILLCQHSGEDAVLNLHSVHTNCWDDEYTVWALVSTTYRIRPNYRTYPYKRTVKQFHSLQTKPVYFLFVSL